MHKILIACSLAAVALAAPEADADALYGAYGYGYAYPALYNAYPNWPGYSAPGFSRTIFGARGKRSAEAAPEADADAHYGAYGYGYAYPALYNSYPNWPGYSAPGFSRTIFGARGKRSAEAEPEADADAHYGAYGYGYAYPALYNSYPNWPGVSAPGFSSTVFGLRGKRSADADAHYSAYGYGLRAFSPYYYGYGLTGVAGHPTGSSYVARSPQGLSLRGKRSAEAEPEADAYYGGYGYGGYYGRGYGYPLGYRGYGYGGLYGYGRGYYSG
jgi:hypothetical protein